MDLSRKWGHSPRPEEMPDHQLLEYAADVLDSHNRTITARRLREILKRMEPALFQPMPTHERGIGVPYSGRR